MFSLYLSISSQFLLRSKDMHVKLISDSQMTVVWVIVFVSLCWPCDGLVNSPLHRLGQDAEPQVVPDALIRA